MLMIKLTSFVPSGVYVVKLGKRVLLRSMLCKRSTYLKFRHQNIWFLHQLIDIQFIIKKRLFVNLFPHHGRWGLRSQRSFRRFLCGLPRFLALYLGILSVVTYKLEMVYCTVLIPICMYTKGGDVGCILLSVMQLYRRPRIQYNM